MKVGLSSYSFRPLMQSGAMQIEDVFAWVGKHGGDHVELATLSVAPEGQDLQYELADDAEMLKRLTGASQKSGIPLSGLCMSGNFIDDGERAFQLNRLKRYVELCDKLGVRFLRHDVVPWSLRATEPGQFEAAFPAIADATHELAAHAGRYGVTTSVEDHGFFMNSSERIKRLLHAVNLPSFRLTVDIGNFLCVDENPLTGTRACLPHASFVHLKDFYVRQVAPGADWLQTVGGQAIRGSVFGYGDLPVQSIVADIVASGYDGFVSLEYEGNEPTQYGCETGLKNAKAMFAAAAGR
ncbi:sugar phosphate isomerase/epimerase family protein [Rhizobium multihospitium]|uniref:Sugar phosphate isomerase/epimerase n=1 Tax=Rhizobium multihospitium TaxID=410764 RepID=A0A1C3W770_9HYPH|nr:sugar phosphate isomerase/epimerase family protein [Rhizobium multihospitium]SCB35658.1 Sugar phosphate isomerase/epimerase [Rhizobium multihospitium]